VAAEAREFSRCEVQGVGGTLQYSAALAGRMHNPKKQKAKIEYIDK